MTFFDKKQANIYMEIVDIIIFIPYSFFTSINMVHMS